MSKNLTRKGLALFSGAALALTSLVGIAAPANAAGEVTLAPTTGTGATVFSTDPISLTTTVLGTAFGGPATDTLAYRIDNPDQHQIDVRFTGITSGTVTGITETGATVALGTFSGGGAVIDPDDSIDIVAAVFHSFNTHAATSIAVSLDKAAVAGLSDGATPVPLVYGDRTTDASLSVSSWVEVQSPANYASVDARFASAKVDVTYVDPSAVTTISEIVRSVGTGFKVLTDFANNTEELNLNQKGDAVLTANVRFSRTDINLSQVDLTQFKYQTFATGTGNNPKAEAAIKIRASAAAFNAADRNLERITPAGYSLGNRDAYGSMLVRVMAGSALVNGVNYQVGFRHKAATAPQFVSPGFTVVENTANADVDGVASIVTSTTDAKANGNVIAVRAGTNGFTYRAQARDDEVDVKQSNIPMVAVVRAGTLMPTGEAISVTGSTKQITRANEAVIVSGLTNADGRFAVTVTSATAAALQSYTVQFFIGDGFAGSEGTFQSEAVKTATYATAAPNAVTATPAIAASSEVTVKVAITDQFGSAISTRGTAALNVELKAPTKTNLEQFKAVENGEASFTFTNYLKTGESDILTARVYVGTSTSPTYVGSLSTNVSLFAPAAVTAINVAPEVTSVEVNYVDFITGKTSAAKPGPTSGTTYTGTVVNANGSGIPGAAVTISGTGFQFKSGSTFSIDSVTLTTDAAGTFSVELWTTVASAAGNKLTVTSGDKTASTLIKSAIPATQSTKNLTFSWDLPASLVTNTTYAVTAKVADKHGNGVSGASVKFSGFGAATFNGAADATRTTDRNGNVTAFLRSLKDVDGISAIGVELLGTGLAFTSGEGLAAVYTNAATTAHDESKWSSTIEAPINFLKTAPAASAATGKVNVGSFNGKLVVYAAGLDGAKISWKVAGRWGVANASGNLLNRFDRPVGASGVNVNVEIYVNGVKQLTKTVLTR